MDSVLPAPLSPLWKREKKIKVKNFLQNNSGLMEKSPDCFQYHSALIRPFSTSSVGGLGIVVIIHVKQKMLIVFSLELQSLSNIRVEAGYTECN